MKSKLAVWSWVLPVLGLGFNFVFLLSSIHIALLIGPVLVVLVFGSFVVGLILGIIGLRKINKNHELSGRAHAIVGIILSSLLFIYGIFMLLTT